MVRIEARNLKVTQQKVAKTSSGTVFKEDCLVISVGGSSVHGVCDLLEIILEKVVQVCFTWLNLISAIYTLHLCES